VATVNRVAKQVRSMGSGPYTEEEFQDAARTVAQAVLSQVSSKCVRLPDGCKWSHRNSAMIGREGNFCSDRATVGATETQNEIDATGWFRRLNRSGELVQPPQ